MSGEYWTKAERELLRTNRVEYLSAHMIQDGTATSELLDRSLATVDALEQALTDEHWTDAATHETPCDTCALLAALEAK